MSWKQMSAEEKRRWLEKQQEDIATARTLLDRLEKMTQKRLDEFKPPQPKKQAA